MCVLWAGYAISERPFEDPELNIMEVVNNVLYWILLVFCFGLTYAVNNEKTKEDLGLLFMALVLIILLVNASFMITGFVKTVNLKLKRFYVHYRVK